MWRSCDMAAQERGASFLDAVAAGTGTASAFLINRMSGALAPLFGGSGLPIGSAQGLAAD